MIFNGSIDEAQGIVTTETVLDAIVAKKKIRVEEQKKKLPLEKLDVSTLDSIPSSFDALQPQPDCLQVIAEFKIASPSKGIILSNFNPETTPEYFFNAYKEGGAAALSVLTEEDYFQGNFTYLERAVKTTHLPILCKDFIIDPYQIVKARYHGASAILLIVALLNDDFLQEFYDEAMRWGLDVLVEVHTPEEAMRALKIGAKIIGINNRNLKTFQTSLTVTEDLAPLLKKQAIVVAESGIKSPEDALRMKHAGASALLIGEGCVTASDVSKTVHSYVFCQVS